MGSCGLYIHIPFCVRKCNYCDFLSMPFSEELAREYRLALFSEMELLSKKYNHPSLQTIYLGGGTPTCLRGEVLAGIVDAVASHFGVSMQEAEVTCEVNPATVDEDDLRAMRSGGINRLSIGVQAFDDRLLRDLGRIHDVKAVLETYALARNAGFDNINLDLIFALPGQSADDWQRSLDMALALEPEHLSLYNLKIEEGTPFHRDYVEGRLIPVEEELDLWMYEEAIRRLTSAGLNQYEISNFARPGRMSRHNLRYWHYEPYLALGPGAHGFDGRLRYENISDLREYRKTIVQGHLPWSESLQLTEQDRMEEFMIMGLRLMEGIALHEFTRRFGVELQDVYAAPIEKLIRMGLLELTEGRLRLTEAGVPLGNQAFLEFLL